MGCKIISDNFSEQFLEQLCQQVKKSKHSPGETIFKTGELNDKLFIILEGEIKIYVDEINCYNIIRYFEEKSKKVQYLRSYKAGFVIGSKNFLINQKREFCAKTSKFSELAYIEWTVKHN
jgi:CRP-like cAMP-binding protein